MSDVSTAVLIKHFYRNYGSMPKAEALRKAQLQVKRYYPHPSYWSGFSLTGNYNCVSITSAFKNFKVAG